MSDGKISVDEFHQRVKKNFSIVFGCLMVFTESMSVN
jgi:hypothetical protein